ncbi:siderophore-interacting protein [Nocardia sp. alder85J]|uniref:siderophore-interacting protein n=1 Tax=Nocardia sp. alder85J TaxID=2862949 RepID=UPI001CD7B2F7|nr:siderophore-interacting protein [Nocardia sp. alder85J]MCX4097984.1 siderophore-interacting protein [Nocardia sp. alder85J]
MAHPGNPAQTPEAPEQPSSGRRSRTLGDRLLDRFLHTAHVLETEQIAARTTRIRLGGPQVRELTWIPGQQVRIATGDGEGGSALSRMGDLRTYSVWHHDPDAGELHLCVLDHGDGPGARWGRTARVGQEVRFRGPEGSFTLRDDAPYHLFAGEETAAVAFGPMLRTVPSHVPVHGAIETATEADRLPLHRAATLAQPLRGSASAASSEILLTAVRALDLPDEPGAAYLAGEARTIQLISKHLVHERNWPRRAIRTKPFWTPGRRGMD